jgi:pre-mRNA-processing factor SLU7
VFAGDNFVRHTGEAREVLAAQAFAWEQYNKGADVNAQANPTELALLRKKAEEETAVKTVSQKEALMEMYGAANLVKKVPKELLFGETESFAKYSKDGRVIGGPVRCVCWCCVDRDHQWRDGGQLDVLSVPGESSAQVKVRRGRVR